MTCSFEWVTVWTFVGASATCVLAGTAVCALKAAKGQISTMREVAAFQMLSDVLMAGTKLDNPKYLTGKIETPHTNPKYIQYITLLLLAFENILRVTCKDDRSERYRSFVKESLINHKNYISQSDGSFCRLRWISNYNEALVEIMRLVVEEQKPNA